MSILTLDPTGIGKPLFEGDSTIGWLTKDNAFDNADSSGTYLHRADEFSAYEANEWQSFFDYLQSVLVAGVPAVPVRNTSVSNMPAGTMVYLSGYSSGVLTASLADSAHPGKQATHVLPAAIPATSNGFAYQASLVSGLDTHLATAGALVYLSGTTPGAWSLTAPTATNQFAQVAGIVTLVSSGQGQIAFFPGLAILQRLGSSSLPSDTAFLDAVQTFTAAQTFNKLKALTGGAANITGTAALTTGGTVTVATTAVTTASTILLSYNTPKGGVTGILSAPSASISDGVHFVINSSDTTDVTSTVNWFLIN